MNHYRITLTVMPGNGEKVLEVEAGNKKIATVRALQAVQQDSGNRQWFSVKAVEKVNDG